jgi:rhamnogalacturonyl hydrolase YesR
LRGYLRELADALLAVQDKEGMWHQLLHLPLEDSYPETSGTALISYNLARAWKIGALPEERYRAAAVRSFEAVARRVGEDGTVAGTCKGPGPLRSINGYYRTPGELDDPHGHFAVLFACAGMQYLAAGK